MLFRSAVPPPPSTPSSVGGATGTMPTLVSRRKSGPPRWLSRQTSHGRRGPVDASTRTLSLYPSTSWPPEGPRFCTLRLGGTWTVARHCHTTSTRCSRSSRYCHTDKAQPLRALRGTGSSGPLWFLVRAAAQGGCCCLSVACIVGRSGRALQSSPWWSGPPPLSLFLSYATDWSLRGRSGRHRGSTLSCGLCPSVGRLDALNTLAGRASTGRRIRCSGR